MSAGKAAAQAVHASAMVSGIEKFGKEVVRTVVILEAKNTQQLLSFHTYLNRLGFESKYYIDEGVNEVGAYSITALAFQPIWSGDEEIRSLFSSFPLYKSNDYQEAYSHLYNVRNTDGLFEDTTPSFVRKTLKWLKEKK